MVLITLEDSDTRTASDLAGKRLMYRRHLSGGNIAALLFRQGLTSSNYTGLTHSHDAMSVYITDQPFKQQSSGISSRIIDPHDYGVDFYVIYSLLLNDMPRFVQSARRPLVKRSSEAGHTPRILLRMVDLIIEKYAPQITRSELLFEAEATIKLPQRNGITLGSVDRVSMKNQFKSLGYLPLENNLEGVWLSGRIHRPGFRRLMDQQAIALFTTLIGTAMILMLALFSNRLRVRVSERADELRVANDELRCMVTKLESARNKANDASRAKDLFLANTSHDIRTPMNGIYGSLQMLGNTLKHESSKMLVKGALVASRHLLEILNDKLDIAKIEAGKLSVENTAFDLSELITSILDTNSSLATEKGIFLNAELELEQNVFSPIRCG